MPLLLHTAISFLTLLIFLSGLAKGQVSHTVIVGQQGSFYDPPTLSAQLNDTVTFIFAGAAHSVTQSSFDNPCSPLKAGFNSGITGIGNNVSATPPTWSLQITNVSQPIWFFCENTVPLSHCASGMVGVINPTSIDQYNQFLAAAKAVVGTPPPQPAVTLTGIGAFATNSPAPPTSTSSTTTSSSSSTVVSTTTPSILPTSPTPTPTTETAESNFEAHKGGIIAGIVVGAIVIIVLLMLLFYVLKRRRDQETLKDFFSYSVPSPVNMTSRSGLAALPSSNNVGATTTSSSVSRPNPAPAIISTTRRPSNEFDFSTGYPRGHAYAAVGLGNKDPYAEDVASSSDTYVSDSIITTSAGGISGVSGNTGATRAARRKPSQDRGFDNGRHAPTDGPPLARQTSQTARPATRDQKSADDGGAVNRPPSPDSAPPPLYHS